MNTRSQPKCMMGEVEQSRAVLSLWEYTMSTFKGCHLVNIYATTMLQISWSICIFMYKGPHCLGQFWQ